MKSPDDSALKKEEERSQREQAETLQEKVTRSTDDLWRKFARQGAFSGGGKAFARMAIMGR